MKIIERIKKILQSNVLFLKDKTTPSDNNSVSIDDVYKKYEENNKNNSTNRFKTAKVIFKEKKNKKDYIENLIMMKLSFLKFRKDSLKAMYATKHGYKTCDYSRRKGFYNF